MRRVSSPGDVWRTPAVIFIIIKYIKNNINIINIYNFYNNIIIIYKRIN
jgi:hypothetical protein